MNYDFVRYLWADICLLPHTPEHYSKWDGPHSIKHEPIWIQITILVPSLAHTISYIFISEYSLITCSDTCMHFPKHSSRDCTNCLFLIYPYYYYYSSVFPHSQRWRCVSVFTSICPMLYSIKQYSINSFTAHHLLLFIPALNFYFQNSKSSLYPNIFQNNPIISFWRAIWTLYYPGTPLDIPHKLIKIPF